MRCPVTRPLRITPMYMFVPVLTSTPASRDKAIAPGTLDNMLIRSELVSGGSKVALAVYLLCTKRLNPATMNAAMTALRVIARQWRAMTVSIAGRAGAIMRPLTGGEWPRLAVHSRRVSARDRG